MKELKDYDLEEVSNPSWILVPIYTVHAMLENINKYKAIIKDLKLRAQGVAKSIKPKSSSGLSADILLTYNQRAKSARTGKMFTTVKPQDLIDMIHEIMYLRSINNTKTKE
jgi:phage-related minor tail protein